MRRARRIAAVLAAALVISLSVSAKAPKYVFYFVGDGLGLNQVLGTQMYLADLEGRIGITPLCLAKFPFMGVATTFSASTYITDSAAAGTALAGGEKTRNEVLAMLPDRKTPVVSIAEKAAEAGRQVAIGTTVSINHATPGVFYAHHANRNFFHNIGMQLGDSPFVQFIAGTDFQQAIDEKANDEGCYINALNNGFAIARGYGDYREKAAKAKKMILLQKDEKGDKEHMPFSIDRKEGDMSLKEITTAALDFMMKEPKKGFFMMIEGGRIDQACHGNDAATCFKEVIDFDDAIKVAYDFYLEHKDETLIVVTADHETGALGLGNGEYRLNLKVLQYQDMSEDAFSRHLTEIGQKTGDVLTWEEVDQELKMHFGFGDKIKLSPIQSGRLRSAYVETFGMGFGSAEKKSEEYYKVDKISDVATQIISEIAQISWGSGAHTAAYVPVFAIGNGAKAFTGQMDNTEIPVRIAAAAHYKW